jgi:hypothetical protein
MAATQTLQNHALHGDLPFREDRTAQILLTEEQSAILKDLIKLEATTPLRFEIRTDRIGQNLKQKLDELAALGLVETRGLTVNTKETIYVPSPGATRFIAAIEKAKRTKKRQFSR